jgi:MshEN domain
VSDEAIALAFRTGLPYVGLRDYEHDPELDQVVPPDAARFARAIPLAAADDHVRLAVADPEPDLAALTPYLGERRVELAIAPRDELEELLGPPPPEPPEAVVEEEPEPEPLAVAEPEAVEAEPEPLGAEPEPPAPAEPEPLAAAEPEPAPLAAAAPDSFAPAFPATEEPSWLAPPRKRGWLRTIGRFLLYLLVLALICAAVAAYLLTR